MRAENGGKQNLLEMRNITKNFGGVKALDNVSFELRYNETIGLVGDNGAGKSTLMKILSGLYVPDSGEIYYSGEIHHFSNPSDSMTVGIYMIYQKLALVDEFDASSNIFLGKELKRKKLGSLISVLDKRRMEKEAMNILAPMKIRMNKKLMRTPVRNLSGGQRSSVAIGKVISNDAKLLIMDEPTAALGVKETRQFFDIINKLKERGLSFIFISHRMQDVFTISDRIMILRGGKKVSCEEISKTSIKEVVHYMVGGDMVESTYA